MNVMAQAHKVTKTRIARMIVNGIKPAAYKVIFRAELRLGHKEYKAKCEAMQNAFRNLYKVTDDSGKVLAFITARNAHGAVDVYTLKSQNFKEVKVVQMSHGYHKDQCEIYG